MSKKRGISPVVATVLLIAIVITIALIIFIWFRGFVQDSGEKFGQNVDLVCERVDFDASYSTITRELLISNTGDVPIYSFNVEQTFEGGHDTIDINEFAQGWPNSGIRPQGTFSEVISAVRTQGVTEITLIPILLAESDGQNKAFPCKESAGFTLLV